MVHNLEITGDGMTKCLADLLTNPAVRIRSIKFAAGEDNGAAARVGDSSTDETHGEPIYAMASTEWPAHAEPTHCYPAAAVFAWVATGDKLSVAWEG